MTIGISTISISISILRRKTGVGDWILVVTARIAVYESAVGRVGPFLLPLFGCADNSRSSFEANEKIGRVLYLKKYI